MLVEGAPDVDAVTVTRMLSVERVRIDVVVVGPPTMVEPPTTENVSWATPTDDAVPCSFVDVLDVLTVDV